MTQIVIVSHGQMAAALIQSAEMIVGKLEGVHAVVLGEEDSPDSLKERIEDILNTKQAREGTLILADLPGATPFNVSAVLANQNPGLRIVSGINLPMLIEVVLQRDSISLEELETLAEERGKQGIKTLTGLLNQ